MKLYLLTCKKRLPYFLSARGWSRGQGKRAGSAGQACRQRTAVCRDPFQNSVSVTDGPCVILGGRAMLFPVQNLTFFFLSKMGQGRDDLKSSEASVCLCKPAVCRRSTRVQLVSPSSGKGLCLAAANHCKQFLQAPWAFAGEGSEAKKIKN